MQDVLMIICKHCKNPLGVPREAEYMMLYSDGFDCPDCEGVNPVTEEIKDYILHTRNVG